MNTTDALSGRGTLPIRGVKHSTCMLQFSILLRNTVDAVTMSYQRGMGLYNMYNHGVLHGPTKLFDIRDGTMKDKPPDSGYQ